MWRVDMFCGYYIKAWSWCCGSFLLFAKILFHYKLYSWQCSDLTSVLLGLGYVPYVACVYCWTVGMGSNLFG
ncbi:hypothetical protein Tsubulata_017729 [Turnera subulata]|uniref:Uncharacterized protein n=1 Tax=Turnera subulata TaxID=218843 RepID=A0A9Q0GBW6_9ROSI|nr:hypothetical protein Tsubulata_017729 [Turnera subulata]